MISQLGSYCPIEAGSYISLGHSEDLLETIRMWHEFPAFNNGVALYTQPITEIDGHQWVHYKPNAVLRLTLRSE
jgi:hypothetical protein